MAAAVFASKTQTITRPRIIVESAGTSNWHAGEGANPQSQRVWERAGYRYKHIASHFDLQRFKNSDLVLVMDRSNYANVVNLTDETELHKKVFYLRDFDYSTTGEREVPDPYSLPDEAFEEVLSMVERATDGLVEEFTR